MRARIAVVALVVFALGAAAFAAEPGTPDVSQLGLRASDFPGAKVTQKATVPTSYVAGYERSFELKTPYGSSLIVILESDVALAANVGQVASDVAKVEAVFRSKAGRAAFALTVAHGAGKTVKASDVVLGAMRHPALGDHAVEQPLSIKLKKVKIYESLVFFGIDRVLHTLFIAGAKPVVAKDTVSLGALIVSHSSEGLMPLTVAPPAITGTPQQGQTLTASTGTWGNVPTFAYQWQRCDATGAACVDVAGATASTYAVTAADAGTTLRVTVNATNRFGSAKSQSAPTAAIA